MNFLLNLVNILCSEKHAVAICKCFPIENQCTEVEIANHIATFKVLNLA